ncbi:MAG: hypothetical protein KC618_07955, partial [Candidatus Omnitrophica bacterium]|nr:hypothetical protein [Candidatus Omnitrophota bacterium]
FDKADKDLTEALNLKPDNIDALFLKGLVLEAGGHPQSAQRFYEATLAVDPEHPEARARLNQLTE